MSTRGTMKARRRHLDVLAAKRAYAEGRNVTELLRQQRDEASNTAEIIEIAYDVQSGAYIEKAQGQAALVDEYCLELAGLVAPHVSANDVVLDVGTGEVTILSGIIGHLRPVPRHVFAFDVSWSRLYLGISYAREMLGTKAERLTPFVAEIGEIPFSDKSIDLTLSNHALEPNGGHLEPLMAELFRVTRRRMVLFEPCYEMNSEDQRRRMDRLGYIKDVAGVVTRLGGRVLEMRPLRTLMNPANPTVCFVIEPPMPVRADDEATSNSIPGFTVPGTSLPLDLADGFYFSNETGYCFPVLRGIPVLRASKGVLATALSMPA